MPARVEQCADSSSISEMIKQRREHLVAKECGAMQRKIDQLLEGEKTKQMTWAEDVTKELKWQIDEARREAEWQRSQAIWSGEKRSIKKHKELNEKLNVVIKERDERIRAIEHRCQNFWPQTQPLFLIRWAIE